MTAEAPARTLEFRPGESVSITAADWEERAAQVRQGLAEDGLADSIGEALGSFRFIDEAGRTWTYDGAAWQAWDGGQWSPGAPPPSLRLQPFALEALPDVPEEPPQGVAALDESAEVLPTAAEIAESASAPADVNVVVAEATAAAPGQGTPALATSPPPTYVPTHIVPAGGLPTWSRPDPAIAPDDRLDPGLDVMVPESYPNGWARIVCSNTWSGWVDGRLLVPIGGSTVSAAAQSWSGTPTAALASRPSPGLDLRSELGLAALLGFVVWFLAVFVAPVPLRFTILGSPLPAGLIPAVVLLALKLLRRQTRGAREVLLFVADTLVAAVVLWAFTFT